MDKSILSEFSKGFTEALLNFCESPAPEPAFVSRLEQKLLERQAVLHRSAQDGRSIKRLWKQFFGSFTQRRWQYALVVLLAVFTIVLFAIGPQRVLAQVQRWLGYIPGIGFVDLAQARILPTPFSLQRESVTLQIDQVLAEPDRTVVVISSQGLPEEHGDYLSSSLNILPKPILRLPDGSTLEVIRQDLYYGGGKLEFPALPEGVYKITFEIDRLPLLPPGAAPEGWQVPLVLRPATGELPADLFPQPYVPADANATVNGVVARILQVAQSTDETAIQMQFEWENPDWELQSMSFLAELRDDLGNVYRPLDSNTQVASVAVQEAQIVTSTVVTQEKAAAYGNETYRFPAISLAASEATFRLSSVEFSIPDTASFTYDPGSDPQLGQTWTLDEQMEIAGIPLHLIGARLDRDEQTFPNEQEPFYNLGFTFLTPTDLPRMLSSFTLQSDSEDYRGGGGGMQEPGVYKIEMLFKRLPQEPQLVTIGQVGITLEGPWEIQWQIPWTGEALQPEMLRLKPEEVEETHNGVTLQAKEAFFSDQVSVISLGMPNLPAGSRLLNVLTFDPSTASIFEENQLYLEELQGKRIELAKNVSWQPEGEVKDDSLRLVFDPLPPLAERVTLHVPAIELFLPGQADFEFEVPEGLNFHSEEFKVPDIGQNNGQQKTTQIRWMSEPWEVDISVEITGYELHFIRAQIERDLNTEPPYRLILTSEPISREIDGKFLSAVNLSAIIRPDGQLRTSEGINEMMRWYGLLYDRMLTENYDPSSWNAKIFLDVTTENRLNLLPGTYQVEIDGMAAWVSGPWELSWSLSGR